MRAALWTGFYHDLPVVEALRRMHRAGWRCVEIATEHLRELRGCASPGCVGAAKAVLEELGISAPQAHAHLSANFADDDEASRTRDLALAFEELPICAELGVTTVVLHPGRSAEADRDVSLRRSADAFAQLAERAGELGLRIAVENMMGKGDEAKGSRFGSTIGDLFNLIDAVHASNLGICLDTSHAQVEGLDLAEAVRAAASKLWAVHVSDNDGERDLHLHPFYGNINWPPFLAALREVGFDGPLNLEIGGFAPVPWLPARDAKCRHARELAELMTSGLLEKPEQARGSNPLGQLCCERGAGARG